MSDIAAVSPFSPWKFIHSGVLITFGVALPLAAVLYELGTHLNAKTFFDPMPTMAHIALIVFVIAANAWCCLVVKGERLRHVQWTMRALGLAIGVAGVYSVLFAPLLPLATVGILYYPLTFLAYAPLAALIVALRLRVHLSRRCKEEGIRVRVWPGILAGVAALTALNAPTAITGTTARMAVSASAETRAQGMYLLRLVGSERVLLRMCYVRSASPLDLIGFFLGWGTHEITPDTARMLYYRTTGHAFNSLPPPVDLRSGRARLFEDDFDWDQGSESVGGRLKGLSLAASRIDGSVSADAALGYLEWTLTFANASTQQREARAQIALPPGAVVSRLTLWIDGEEREAAFDGRGQIRQAYESIVRQSRDPAIVTTAGPDRISLQLFPVPPAGQMKVRVGMTVPLQLTPAREGILHLPFFQERNFGLREKQQHAVWIESKAGAHPEVTRTQIADEKLADYSIVAKRGGPSVAWALDTRSVGQVIRQTISDAASQAPAQIVIVVDGSSTMAEAAEGIANTLATIPAQIPVRLVLAHDASDGSIEKRVMTGVSAAKEIKSFDYDGGHDNTDALVRGFAIADEQMGSVLLWIHGPQPVRLQPNREWKQRLLTRETPIEWYELQAVPGTNRVTDDFEHINGIHTVRADDLPRLIASWRVGARRVNVLREPIQASPAVMPLEQKTSDHLVRLWAYDEIRKHMHGDLDEQRSAVETAQLYQLVTPISGAVVLETHEQYIAAGLEPVAEGTVPTIPEPEEWALMIVAVLVLGYAYARRRRALVAA